MILAIDIGNSRTKAAVFENDTIFESFVFETISFEKKILEILENNHFISHLVVASVGLIDKTAFETFKKRVEIHFVSHQDPFPFKNKYQTPQTLGIDRIVLAAGAVLKHPNQNRLVIDAGTCITYDFMNQNNEYLGGAIAPGLGMRYKALNHYTAKLPLLENEAPTFFIGNSTAQSIHSGVVNGLIFEIDGFIDQYKVLYSNFIIILTGGDAVFLAKRLKNTIFANSNFLLESLNQTFQYKIKND
ncbi:MAG: Type pantothenate kinase [Bacteroidota bacterium]|nr:Type pantothenate kinase [Bacteroidota bacterium]